MKFLCNSLNILFFSKRCFDVASFGTGSQVKLPGGRADEPNVYTFDTTYEEMYYDLMRKDRNLYPSIEKRFFMHLRVAHTSDESV